MEENVGVFCSVFSNVNLSSNEKLKSVISEGEDLLRLKWPKSKTQYIAPETIPIEKYILLNVLSKLTQQMTIKARSLFVHNFELKIKTYLNNNNWCKSLMSLTPHTHHKCRTFKSMNATKTTPQILFRDAQKHKKFSSHTFLKTLHNS